MCASDSSWSGYVDEKSFIPWKINFSEMQLQELLMILISQFCSFCDFRIKRSCLLLQTLWIHPFWKCRLHPSESKVRSASPVFSGHQLNIVLADLRKAFLGRKKTWSSIWSLLLRSVALPDRTAPFKKLNLLLMLWEQVSLFRAEGHHHKFGSFLRKNLWI